MMRTLEQIEPRIPIATLPWTVSAAGSYYVVTNLVGDPLLPDGIIVQASDVTIDLKGFTLQGGAGGGSGINASGGVKNLKVHNGIIRNWMGDGIKANNADSGQLTDLRSSNNGGVGINIGMGWTVAACQCYSNANAGLNTTAYCTVKDCTAGWNGGAGIFVGGYSVLEGCATMTNWVGIATGPGCTVAKCTAANNSWFGFNPAGSCVFDGCAASFNGTNGFAVYPGCRVVNCTALYNKGNGFEASLALTNMPGFKISGCTAMFNQLNGIVVSCQGSIVENCVTSQNQYDGIYVGSRNCFILNNASDANGQSGPGWAGIRITSYYCRIDGNSVTMNNGPGMFTGPNNNNCLIVRNTAHGNLVNFGLAAGTFNAQIIAIAGGGFISTDPLANFTY